MSLENNVAFGIKKSDIDYRDKVSREYYTLDEEKK